mmetsp:Transcript_75052/g.243986  ORF Transcript_75052/g.243986 Transcript_75052/m.243986 type:complete len:217 (+) Transcript_75052:740-1390(+)
MPPFLERGELNQREHGLQHVAKPLLDLGVIVVVGRSQELGCDDRPEVRRASHHHCHPTQGAQCVLDGDGKQDQASHRLQHNLEAEHADDADQAHQPRDLEDPERPQLPQVLHGPRVVVRQRECEDQIHAAADDEHEVDHVPAALQELRAAVGDHARDQLHEEDDEKHDFHELHELHDPRIGLRRGADVSVHTDVDGVCDHHNAEEHLHAVPVNASR